MDVRRNELNHDVVGHVKIILFEVNEICIVVKGQAELLLSVNPKAEKAANCSLFFAHRVGASWPPASVPDGDAK